MRIKKCRFYRDGNVFIKSEKRKYVQFLLKYAWVSGCLYVKCGNSDEKFLVTLYKKNGKKLESVDIDIKSHLW